MAFDPISAAVDYDTDLDSVFNGSALLPTNGDPDSYVDSQVGSESHMAQEEDDVEEEEEEEDENDDQQDQTTFQKAYVDSFRDAQIFASSFLFCD
jgi:hypothetical protein